MPDGTTTLVYDNLFFFLAHGVDGLRSIVDQMNAAPAHVRWVARIAPQSAYDDEAERFATDVVAPLLAWPEVVASRRDHELDGGRPRRAAARGRDRRRQGGAPARRGPQRRRLLRPPQRALARPASPPTTRRSRARRRSPRLRLGMWTMLRQSSLRPDLEAMLRDLAPVIDAARAG